MGKRSLVIIPALAFFLVILTEDVSLRGVLVALGVSFISVFFTTKFIPSLKISDVKFIKLITFPFYLIGQIYVAGFQIIRILFKGSKAAIVTVNIDIKAEVLRVILVEAITLTPGSILLELNDESVTLLWILDKNTPADPAIADKQLKEKLEQRLLKAQRGAAS